MLEVRDIVYRGNGMTIAFNDNSVVEATYKLVNGLMVLDGVTAEQLAALERANALNTNVDGSGSGVGGTGPNRSDPTGAGFFTADFGRFTARGRGGPDGAGFPSVAEPSSSSRDGIFKIKDSFIHGTYSLINSGGHEAFGSGRGAQVGNPYGPPYYAANNARAGEAVFVQGRSLGVGNGRRTMMQGSFSNVASDNGRDMFTQGGGHFAAYGSLSAQGMMQGYGHFQAGGRGNVMIGGLYSYIGPGAGYYDYSDPQVFYPTGVFIWGSQNAAYGYANGVTLFGNFNCQQPGADRSFIHGGWGDAQIADQKVWTSNRVGNAYSYGPVTGWAQCSLSPKWVETTDISTTNIWTLPLIEDKTYLVTSVDVVARDTDTDGESAMFYLPTSTPVLVVRDSGGGATIVGGDVPLTRVREGVGQDPTATLKTDGANALVVEVKGGSSLTTVDKFEWLAVPKWLEVLG